jgi:hypothetical protein
MDREAVQWGMHGAGQSRTSSHVNVVIGSGNSA